MPQKVTDESGQLHSFPDDATPEMIAEALGLNQTVSSALPGESSGLARYRFQQQSLGVDDPSQSASFWSTLKASLHPSVEKQIRQYAQGRGIEIERYGVDREGNVVYLNDSGQVVREIPSVTGAQGLVDLLRRAGQFTGSQAGPALPQAAAAGTSALMGGTPASIPAAAGAAGVVDLMRQGVGNLFLGDPVTDVDLMNAAGQATLGGVGAGLTTGINKLVNRNPLRVGRQDVANLRDPAALQRYMGEQESAALQGIQVTPGETTGAKSLLQRQRQLGRFPESATTMEDFYKLRSGVQVPQAVENLRGQLSPQMSAGMGAESLRKGSLGILDDLTLARSEAAKRAYEPVNDVTKLMEPEKFQAIAGDPFLKTIFGKVKNDQLFGFQRVPENALPVIDAVKKEMDDLIAVAERAGEKNRARLLKQKREILVGLADESFPEYRPARERFAEMSRPIEDVEDSLTGLVAADERVRGTQGIPSIMFGRASASPEAIAKARNQFAMSGKLNEWNAGLSSFIGRAWDDVAKQGASTGTFFSRMYKDPVQKANLRAAMSDDQWNAYEALMKTLEKVARAPVEGSPTATDIGSREAFASGGARAAGVAAQAFGPWNWPSAVKSFILDMSAGRNADKIATLITSPSSVKELQKLRMLPPGSEKAMALLNSILVNVGVRSNLPDPPAQEPPALLGAP